MCWKRAGALLLLLAVATMASLAQTFATLANFDGTNGWDPYYGSLVQATNGDLYGTTGNGGASAACASGCGTIFKITPAGALSTVYSFCSQTNCTDGTTPLGALVQATNGYLYGTTTYGGGGNCSGLDPLPGCGTIFKITPAGALTTIHSFHETDGEFPEAGLVQAFNGDLYGTTYGGGTCCGTVFKITPAGTLTTLYNFGTGGLSDGAYPSSGLVQAGNGELYGTTTSTGDAGAGTVFKITPAGALTILHTFGGPDGSYPWAGLVQATNGLLYGTTRSGGASGYGTIFKITPAGTLSTVYSFCSEANCTDGSLPFAGLLQGTDGDLYGTTAQGGSNISCGCGTIFKITPAGVLTTEHSFDKTDGASPTTGLAQDTNGAFYGTAFAGGANNGGTIFRLSVGLGDFVKTLPTLGEAGSAVKVLGSGLTGATSVTFNGTPAVFTVVDAAEITTTVPTGATTGRVQVVTPSGALLSNVDFLVP